MSVTVRIPTQLRALTAQEPRVHADGATVDQVLLALEARYPGLRERLRDEHGHVRQYINLFVNGEDVRHLQNLQTPVTDGDEVGIMPAMAGGAALTPAQVERYSRHILMPQVGSVGQRRLLESKVLLIGAGGLGSPAAMYLAAAGVGTLGIVDYDVVDASNLQRQLLHRTADVGRRKVDSAAETIASINPDVTVVKHPVALTSENVLEIFGQYDVIVNGCDNFATRYLASDAAYWAGKPLVDGSILLFEGQATVYVPGEGCYRCLFPTPPPPGEVPSCAEAGVLGVLPGIIGCVQAIETIKLLLGLGEPLIGRLLVFDALQMEFNEFKLRRNPACPVCGENPTITEPIDYFEFCGAPPLVAVGEPA